jgi:hypothetical protein
VFAGAELAPAYRDIAAVPDSGSLHCLLDFDADLAEELEPSVRRAARAAATAVVMEVDPGRIPLGSWLNITAKGPGVLLLDGLLTSDVRVGNRTAAEIIGAGDLVQAPRCEHDQLLSCQVEWRSLIPGRLALLDQSFARRTRFWPQIAQALMRRIGSRAYDLDVQRAIALQPRLEIRLSLLLWHLAARWGKVEPGGIRLPLPLTHQLLGRLIGAERPSVSHALARLARAGLVSGHGDEWHLHGNIRDHLGLMIDPAAGRVEQLLDAAGAVGPG